MILPPTPDRSACCVGGCQTVGFAGGASRASASHAAAAARIGRAGPQSFEIDVSDPDDVTIMEPRDGHVLKAPLRGSQLCVRYRNFVTHYAEIVERLPGAVTLDLRLEDRITVVSS